MRGIVIATHDGDETLKIFSIINLLTGTLLLKAKRSIFLGPIMSFLQVFGSILRYLK